MHRRDHGSDDASRFAVPTRLFAMASWAALVGCAPATSLYERCGAVCDACGVGYCIAGGGSGWCSDPGRAECIVAAADDCFELRHTCIAGPSPAALCNARCGVCGIRDCLADDGSGPCADPARAACVLAAAEDISTPEDCDEIRSCLVGPLLDAGADDADAIDAMVIDAP